MDLSANQSAIQLINSALDVPILRNSFLKNECLVYGGTHAARNIPSLEPTEHAEGTTFIHYGT